MSTRASAHVQTQRARRTHQCDCVFTQFSKFHTPTRGMVESICVRMHVVGRPHLYTRLGMGVQLDIVLRYREAETPLCPPLPHPETSVQLCAAHKGIVPKGHGRHPSNERTCLYAHCGDNGPHVSPSNTGSDSTIYARTEKSDLTNMRKNQQLYAK
jgi:hypothetical protein